MPVLLMTAFILILVFSSTESARGAGPRSAHAAAQARGRTAAATSTTVDVNGKRFDPHDLSGIYVRRGGDPGFGPVKDMPPLTPVGEAKLKRVILPAAGRHPLVKQATDAAPSNDPALACNPKGFPRLLLDTTHDYHEVIMLPNRMLQLWQEERRPREIWLDGRAVPSDETVDGLGPAWYGHAVGVWQGDTLVVNTVGLDDRAWLDSFGFPKSFNARVEERYKLVDPDTLQLTLTLYDPEIYTKPWVSDAKIWEKVPRNNVTRRGWYGLFGLGEAICAPTNGNPFVKRGG
jgi:hypothetical protein